MLDRSRQILFAGRSESAERLQQQLDSSKTGIVLVAVDSFGELALSLEEQKYYVLISELKMSGGDAMDVVNLLRRRSEDTWLVLLLDQGGEALALQCMEEGVEHCVLNDAKHLGQLPALIRNLLGRGEREQQRREMEETLIKTHERYQDIFDNTNDLIQCLAEDGRFLYTNRAWQDALGYSEDETRSLKLQDVLHCDSRACCEDRFERLKRGEQLTQIEFKLVGKSGEVVHLFGDCGSLIKDGEAVSTRGIFKNVTARVKAEAALSASEARYQALYENAPDILAIVDSAGTILSINQTGAEMLGYSARELIGQSATLVTHPDDQENVLAYLQQDFSEANPDNGIEYRKIRKDGSSFWVHQRASQNPDSSGEQLLVICRDVTERRTLENKLAWQASHDTLTSLNNRREFESRMQRLLSNPAIQSNEHVLCYLDLDQFKVVNDTCGHVAGDALLRLVADLLVRHVRSRDTLARLGGDEFAVLMEHCPLERAEQVADSIRKDLDQLLFSWNSRRFSIGVSIGIVPVQKGQSLKDVLSLADSACYAAKDQGRNRVHVSYPDDVAVSGHVGEMHWASIIAGALQQDGLLLYAQQILPCGNSDNGQSLEILLRLKNGSEIVLPEAFMPAAERYNLSTKLDRWVLKTLLKWFESTTIDTQTLASCSINLSALSLCDPDFKTFALELLSNASMPCSKLCFEITETAAISNMDQAKDFIQALRKVGCRFALDDFGSGLASFAYLKDIPVDMIKIDGSFVCDLVISPVDQAMVRSICDIVAMMGKQTTAECVENRETLDVLLSLGVDYVQGYYFGYPQPLEELAGSIENPQLASVPR